MKPIYLDYNATTPIRPEAIVAMQPYLQSQFGNPSSKHILGQDSRKGLEYARSQVAEALHAASKDEIYFCSCGTEADNWAIFGTVSAWKRNRPKSTPHVISSCIEHPAVIKQLEALKHLRLLDYTLVGVNSKGFVNIDELVNSIREETCLVSIMHSNNEIGTIQDIGKIVKEVKKRGEWIYFHTDAAQSVGKIDIDLVQLNVDMCTVVGHKFGAPKGVASLYIRDGVSIDPFLYGGDQEKGMRSGTENVLLAAAMGAAIKAACSAMIIDVEEMNRLRTRLLDNLVANLEPGVDYMVHGPEKLENGEGIVVRLPNTLSISFKSVDASVVLDRLGTQVAASAGSACHGSAVSGVLSSIQVPEEFIRGTLRLSVGFQTTDNDVDDAARLISQCLTDKS
eukprot:jgi/Picsp_1/6186/NSC_03540-R1_cysteine desulfurase